MEGIVVQEGKMSLILDTYGDIFSSFDPRPYEERALSDDFLDECKKITDDKKIDLLELRLLIPKQQRSVVDEELIKKRLHAYFLAQYHMYYKKKKIDMRKAYLLLFLGVVTGVIVSYLLRSEWMSQFGVTLMTVLGEPASWFLIRTGGEKLLQYMWYETSQSEFIYKMSHAKIQFYTY